MSVPVQQRPPAIPLRDRAHRADSIAADGQLESWRLCTSTPHGKGLLRALTVRSWSDLQPFVAQWDELTRTSAVPNPFYSRWMFELGLKWWFGDRRWLVLLVLDSDNHSLLGLFPFEQRSDFRRLPIPTWRSLKHDYTYFCTPLVAAGREQEVWATALDAMAGDRSAQLIELLHFGDADVVGQSLEHGLTVRRWPELALEKFARAALTQPLPEDEHLRRYISAHQRQELRRAERRLGEQGPLQWRQAVTPAEIAVWTDQFLALESRGWKGRQASALSQDRSEGQFFRGLVESAFAQGQLQAQGLYLAGEPVAMKFNLVIGQQAFAFKIAHDERWAKYSPGCLLELKNLTSWAMAGEVQVADSCATPDNVMINRLWPERRVLRRSVFAPGHWPGRMALSAWGAGRSLRAFGQTLYARSRAPRSTEN